MDDFHIVALFALTRSRIHRETLGVLMKVVNNYFHTRSTKIGYIVTHKFIVKAIWCYCICFQANALRTMKIGIFNQLFLTGRIFQKQVKVVTNFGLPMLGSRTLCCPCTLPEINKALASTGHLFCKLSMGSIQHKVCNHEIRGNHSLVRTFRIVCFWVYHYNYKCVFFTRLSPHVILYLAKQQWKHWCHLVIPLATLETLMLWNSGL